MADTANHEMVTRAKELQEEILQIDDALASLRSSREAAVAELRGLAKRDANLGEFLVTCGEEAPACAVENILVVEDNRTMRLLLNHSLSKAGYVVHEVQDTGEAEKALHKNQIDLVILDYMLPGRSGLQFLAQLREKHDLRHIPVIMCTAHHEPEIREKAAELGAQFLPKPINVGEMLRMIRQITPL